MEDLLPTEIWRMSSSHRRPEKDIEDIKDLWKVFKPWKTYGKSSSHRRPAEALLTMEDPTTVF